MAWRDWNYGLDTSSFEVLPEQADLWDKADYINAWDLINEAYIEYLRVKRRKRAERMDIALYYGGAP